MPCFILHFKNKFACYSRCFLASYFCIPVPCNLKDIFFGVLVLKVLVGHHRTINFSFFSITAQVIDLDYHDIDWFALETNRDHSVIFETTLSSAFWTLLLTMMATPFLLRDLSSLIARISTFTLAISCLTTSSLPWFMDLTFQVLTQYYSLQHQTLLLSPVTSTTSCFCFDSVSLFFLELFLHWSPVAYWVPTDLGSSSFSVLSFYLFHTVHVFLRQEYWSGLPFPSPVDHVLSDLSTMTRPSWLAPYGMN